MRSFLAVALSFSLSLPMWGQPQPAPVEEIKQKAGKWKPGTTVVVKMVTKEKVKGKFVAADNTGIQVRLHVDKKDPVRTVAFDQIRGVGKPVSVWVKLPLIGLGTVTAAVAAACAAGACSQ